jgi:hypothetical protein
MSIIKRILWISLLLNCCSFASQGQQKIFEVRISTPKTTVNAGSPIRLAISLKNVTDKTVSVALNSSDVGVGRTFEIAVLDSYGAALPMLQKAAPLPGEKPLPKTFSGGTLPVAPGHQIVRTVDLNRLFDLSKTGTYTVQVKKIESHTNTIQSSNILPLAVIP